MKDSRTGAVLNVDNVKLEAYKKQKRAFDTNLKNTEKIEKVEKELEEIKKMLTELLQRK